MTLLSPEALAFGTAAAATSAIWFFAAVRPQRLRLEEIRAERDVSAGRLEAALREASERPDRNWLARQVRLAAEHAEGISILLDAARQSGRPVPEPAVRNLAFLRRKLTELEVLIERPPGAADEAGDVEVTPPAAEQAPSGSPLPCEYRVSPFDT